jgi:hypothetical protein
LCPQWVLESYVAAFTLIGAEDAFELLSVLLAGGLIDIGG